MKPVRLLTFLLLSLGNYAIEIIFLRCCPRSRPSCGTSDLDLGLIGPSYTDAFSPLYSYGDYEDDHENAII